MVEFAAFILSVVSVLYPLDKDYESKRSQVMRPRPEDAIHLQLSLHVRKEVCTAPLGSFKQFMCQAVLDNF